VETASNSQGRQASRRHSAEDPDDDWQSLTVHIRGHGQTGWNAGPGTRGYGQYE
jgi:hypothetical protein